MEQTNLFEQGMKDPIIIEEGADILSNVSDQDDTGNVQQPQQQQQQTPPPQTPPQSGPQEKEQGRKDDAAPQSEQEQQAGATASPDGSVNLNQMMGGPGPAVELLDAALKRGEKLAVYLTGYQPYPGFHFTKQEKEILLPVVGRCLETIKINLNNPWHMLLLTVGGMVSAKALMSSYEKVGKGKKEKTPDKTHVMPPKKRQPRSDAGKPRGSYKPRAK